MKVRFAEDDLAGVVEFAAADRRSSTSDAIRVLVQLGLEAWRAGFARTVGVPQDGVWREPLRGEEDAAAGPRELTSEPVRDWA